jgi:hypothetical protein
MSNRRPTDNDLIRFVTDAIRDAGGSITVNPLAHYGESAIWRAVRVALGRGVVRTKRFRATKTRVWLAEAEVPAN